MRASRYLIVSLHVACPISSNRNVKTADSSALRTKSRFINIFSKIQILLKFKLVAAKKNTLVAFSANQFVQMRDGSSAWLCYMN